MPQSVRDAMLKSYLKILPSLEHLTNISAWDQDTLNEIDSKHLQQSYVGVNSYYRSLYG